MFKINRRSLSSKTTTLGLNRSRQSSYTSISKSILNKSFKDYGRHLNKLSTLKINSFKRLTKLNIKLLLIKRIKARADLNAALKLSKEKLQIDNKNIIYKNNVLPSIPEYTPISNRLQNIELTNTDISKLPKKTIETQEDMANLFNQIINGQGLPPKFQDDGTVIYNLQNNKIENNEKVKSFLDISQYIPEILLKIKSDIIDDKRILYIKYILVTCNLYFKFPNNNMIKSIILRALEKTNRQQIFKIPSDKLQDLVQLILKYLK